MGQIDELKVFVSERLNAFTSEILGAIEKTLSDYEVQASRLKEENDRHRCLLDIIVKAKLPETEAPAVKNDASPCASDPTPRPRRHRDPPRHTSGDLQCVFTSQTDFMKFAGDDNCPFCIRSVQASEKHLVKKHFLSAVHFVVDGTGEFDTKLKWNMRLCSNNILISIQTLKKAAIVSLSRAVCHSM